MDISVSRLNNRMALQVPGELPLGLVFIVGRVENLGAPAGGTVRFELVDAKYRLRCRLPAAVAEETLLKEGDRARASGHLAFDSHSAQYELLARDIEVLAARPPTDEERTPATTAVQPPADAASLAPTELPPWVRKLAPPEVKEELGLEQEGEPEPSLEPDVAGEPRPETDGRATKLPPEMVAFLSNAIDSDEEIELTPEMIAEYLPQPTPREEGVRETELMAAAAEEEEEVIAKEEEEEPALESEGPVGPPGGEANEGQEEEEREVEAAAADEKSAPPPPDQVPAAPESETPETPRPTVLSPPKGAPRREVRGQPQPQPAAPATTRRYLEYAAIALLVILIMAALFLILLLLQT
ncbi:MAG: exodeoxyribonuclease VII large subunit [Candidatus Promineifilaceae bacterium]|nr:exodeoxyribonuclease VII large subunit [Candidatus Promineifilaceae bacterium]